MKERAHGHGTRSSGIQESAHTISQSNNGHIIPKIDSIVPGQSQKKGISSYWPVCSHRHSHGSDDV